MADWAAQVPTAANPHSCKPWPSNFKVHPTDARWMTALLIADRSPAHTLLIYSTESFAQRSPHDLIHHSRPLHLLSRGLRQWWKAIQPAAYPGAFQDWLPESPQDPGLRATVSPPPARARPHLMPIASAPSPPASPHLLCLQWPPCGAQHCPVTEGNSTVGAYLHTDRRSRPTQGSGGKFNGASPGLLSGGCKWPDATDRSRAKIVLQC